MGGRSPRSRPGTHRRVVTHGDRAGLFARARAGVPRARRRARRRFARASSCSRCRPPSRTRPASPRARRRRARRPPARSSLARRRSRRRRCDARRDDARRGAGAIAGRSRASIGERCARAVRLGGGCAVVVWGMNFGAFGSLGRRDGGARARAGGRRDRGRVEPSIAGRARVRRARDGRASGLAARVGAREWFGGVCGGSARSARARGRARGVGVRITGERRSLDKRAARARARSSGSLGRRARDGGGV